MLRYLNDISIRGKLILIVTGTVTLLTGAMLITVLFTARKHVDAAIHDELMSARTVFLNSGGDLMRVHVLEAKEAKEVANTATEPLSSRDRFVICRMVESTLSGNTKDAHLDPDTTFDLAAIMLPDNTPIGIAVRGTPGCNGEPLQWHLPAITDRSRAEVTNWESPGDVLYQLVETPITGPEGQDLGTMIVGFAITDAWAVHIRAHSGLEAGVALWHMDGGKVHLVATSTNHLREILTPRIQQGPLNQEEILDGDRYILDTPVKHQSDITYDAQGLHMTVVQSRAKKLQPFIDLRNRLMLGASLTLILGVIIGILISHPIASPLKSLAEAAESVAQGNLDGAHDLMHTHPERMHSRDEIGVLGRSFLGMVKGLKERTAMSAFLSHSTYEHIHSNTEEGKQDKDGDSERKTLAILFSDVRKFSNFSETRSPEVVIQLLNQVLSIEAQIVEKNGGDIDKFVGDAVVAWFSGEDRCQRAVRAANEMVAALNATFGGQAGTTIGVGINAGEVVVGSIGSNARKDYTAIGSNVNMAARLCSNAQPGQVLVSNAVAQEVGSEINLKPLAPILLKGFSEPVPIFEATLKAATSA